FCPADHIPENFVIDLDGVEIGTSIHISAIAMPDGVSPTITDRDFTVATIAGSAAAKSAADGEGE
ncbi:MAG: 50S ribosomal protein L25, partial [Pseudomonadota bacterium]